MPTRFAVPNPNRLARAIGGLFVALAVLGPFSLLYVPGAIVVTGDAAATASNLREAPGLLRAAIVVEVAIMLVEVAMPVLLYLLFRSVSRGAALTAAFARVAEAVVIGVGLLGSLTALRLAGGPPGALDLGQRDELALLALEVHGDAVLVGQLFFGFSLLLLGWLVHYAGFIPRLFGALLGVAAAGYLIDGVGNLLWAGYPDVWGWLVGVTALVGEVPFFLWLLIKGVDPQAWERRAAEPAAYGRTVAGSPGRLDPAR